MDKVESILLKKGAEASLYIKDWHGRKVVVKARLPKKYRPARMDVKIRRYRTIHEPQLMHEAKKAGIPTPSIFLVDVDKSVIIMEYIEGKQVKQVLDRISEKDREEFCYRIGVLIGKIHQNGVIHGDLTTSNMILGANNRIFFLDFGLGEKSCEFEARGVDLHLMKRALQSTHYNHAEACFKNVIKGYSRVLNVEEAKKIIEKTREIERRGRYIDERKQK